MAGYVIADVEVSNPDGYAEYRAGVPATLEPYGGEFLVRAGLNEVVEGDWQPKRLVVIRFESVERARAWYASAAYQAILPKRLQNARSNVVIVQGV